MMGTEVDRSSQFTEAEALPKPVVDIGQYFTKVASAQAANGMPSPSVAGSVSLKQVYQQCRGEASA